MATPPPPALPEPVPLHGNTYQAKGKTSAPPAGTDKVKTAYCSGAVYSSSCGPRHKRGRVQGVLLCAGNEGCGREPVMAGAGPRCGAG